jgi:energy-coupling factor transporter ATP-binding protein EcfA2
VANLVIGQNNNQTISWSENFSSWLNPYHHLETRVRALEKNTFLAVEDQKNLQQAFKLANGWTWPAGRMQRLLQNISLQQIQQLLDELLEKGNEKDIPIKLQQYFNVLSDAILLDLSALKTQEKAKKWFHSRGLIKNYALKSNLQQEGRAIFTEFWIEAKYFFHHILEILIAILGVNELISQRDDFNHRPNGYEAIYKLEVYGKLIGYPVLLFGIIYSYIQFKAIALVLTTSTILAIMIAVVVYQRYARPCPKNYPGLKNLNLEVLRSHELTYARQDILRSIERAFQAGKGVILVGQAGAGKSSIPRSLAKQILGGKHSLFSRNCPIFSCGASNFFSFDSLSQCFKNHKDQVIFFFDEFHAFFKEEGLQGSRANEIKMFCEDFKFVIGATTTREYEEFIKEQPAIVDRRFIVIEVGKLQDETIKSILSQYLQAKHPTLNLDIRALDYIVQKAENFNSKTSKIDAAQALLNRAIKETVIVEFKTLESQIDHLEEEKKLIEQELFYTTVRKGEGLVKKLAQKKIALDTLKLELEKKNQQVGRIRKIETFYLKLKEQGFQMASSSINLSQHPQLKRQWIVLQAKIKVVGDFINKEKATLDLPQKLDCQLIDKILAERKVKANSSRPTSLKKKIYYQTKR